MKLLAVLFAALMIAAAPAPALAQERITAPVGGISIEKPAGWHLLPPDEVLANFKSIDLEDPRAQNIPNGPLISITRDLPDRAAGLIPTIKINYVAYPAVAQRGADGTMHDVIDAMRVSVPDIKVVEAPHAVTVAGRKAARARVTFTLNRDGAAMVAESEMIIVPRGSTGFFTISFSYPAGEAGQNRVIFDAALASVRIDAR